MLEDYFFTKNTKWVLWGAFALIVAMLIFHAGVVVGSHQPTRGRMQIDGRGGPGSMGGFVNGFMPRQGFVESGHGAVGTVATVTLPTFTLTNREGVEQKMYAGSTTVVTGGSVNNPSALQKGQFIIVVGDPNDTDDAGYLDARIIHILPSPPVLQ
jgi:hypothetical protein